MVMPQTGPRPVYKGSYRAGAHRVPTGNQVPGAGIQRGKPIFDRRPSTGPGSYQPHRKEVRPQRLAVPGGPRPSIRHYPMADLPAAQRRTGRPPWFQRTAWIWRAPGFGVRRVPAQRAPPTTESARPPRSPNKRPGGSRQQYPKTKEGPMKGFVPPPKYGGGHLSTEPLPITREITVTEGISVKDLAEKLECAPRT